MIVVAVYLSCLLSFFWVRRMYILHVSSCGWAIRDNIVRHGSIRRSSAFPKAFGRTSSIRDTYFVYVSYILVVCMGVTCYVRTWTPLLRMENQYS